MGIFFMGIPTEKHGRRSSVGRIQVRPTAIVVVGNCYLAPRSCAVGCCAVGVKKNGIEILVYVMMYIIFICTYTYIIYIYIYMYSFIHLYIYTHSYIYIYNMIFILIFLEVTRNDVLFLFVDESLVFFASFSRGPKFQWRDYFQETPMFDCKKQTQMKHFTVDYSWWSNWLFMMVQSMFFKSPWNCNFSNPSRHFYVFANTPFIVFRSDYNLSRHIHFVFSGRASICWPNHPELILFLSLTRHCLDPVTMYLGESSPWISVIWDYVATSRRDVTFWWLDCGYENYPKTTELFRWLN